MLKPSGQACEIRLRAERNPTIEPRNVKKVPVFAGLDLSWRFPLIVEALG
jgi:hypothetical protein